MAIFVLDTDILSLHQRKHPQVDAAIASHATDQLCISAITIEEQIGGWSALARAAKSPPQHEQASMFLSALVASWREFAIVPLTQPAILRFEALVQAKLNVKRNDLRIAAIALELGATVITRNRRDFSRVPGRRMDDWSV